MAHIKVVKEITPTEKETYTFNIFEDLSVVFIGYVKEILLIGKRKFITTDKWNQYAKRDSNIPEPPLTFGVRADALNAAIDKLKVKTWSDFKGM